MESVRILAVARSLSRLKRLRSSAAEEGFELLTARSGSEALAIVETGQIDLLLLEDALPGALTVVAAHRAKRGSEPHQIVALTPGLARGGFRGNIPYDDFFAAFASTGERKARIRSAVDRLRRQRELARERDHFRAAIHDEREQSARLLDRHLHLVKAFRAMEGINEELERSNKRLEKIARYDMLSGLLNRSSLFAAMDIEIERAVRNGAPLGGFMTDIDHFKSINDNFGHPYGDEVIRQIGNRLKLAMRTYDSAGRYGGEEFFIILPNTTIDQARMIAERFRESLDRAPVVLGDDTVKVTASLGVAEYRVGANREEWVRSADRAMYSAKQEGRNRTVVEA